MKKRLLAFATVVMMLITFSISIPVLAAGEEKGAEDVTLKLNLLSDKTVYTPGETIDASVVLKGYTRASNKEAGISAYQFELNFDNSLVSFGGNTTISKDKDHNGTLSTNSTDSSLNVVYFSDGEITGDTIESGIYDDGKGDSYSVLPTTTTGERTLVKFKLTVNDTLTADQVEKAFATAKDVLFVDRGKIDGTEGKRFNVNTEMGKITIVASNPVITFNGDAVTGQANTYFDGVTASAGDSATMTLDGNPYTAGTKILVGKHELVATDSRVSGKTTTETITVVRKLDSLTIPSWGSTVIEGSTYKTPTDTATANYADGTNATIANKDLTFDTSKVDTSKAGKYDVTVSYTENGVTKTATYTVEVIENKVTGITATANEGAHVVEGFTSKDSAYLKNLVTVNATLQDGTSKPVTANLDNVVVDEKTNKATLTLSVGDKTTTIVLDVKAPTTESIKVTPPTKVDYIEGQELNLAGGKVVENYEYGLTSVAVDLTKDLVSGYDKTKTGTQIITVTYGEKTDTFTVNVAKKAVTSIEVSKQPSNTTYYVGDIFDATGMEVTAHYNNDTSEVLDSTAYTVDFNSTAAGTVKATVKYNNLTAETTNLTIKDVTVDSIEILTEPTIKEYVEGAVDALDLSGGKIKVSYSNNTTKEFDMTAEMISGFKPNEVGSQVITVAYGNATATFDVTVNKKEVTGIAVKTAPTKTEYLQAAKDETVKFDSTGLVLTFSYNNGKTEDVTFDSKEMTITGFDSSKAGEQVLTVGLNSTEFKTTFKVTVVDRTNVDNVVNDIKTLDKTVLDTDNINELKSLYQEFEELYNAIADLKDVELSAITEEQQNKFELYRQALIAACLPEYTEEFLNGNAAVGAEANNLFVWEKADLKEVKTTDAELKAIQEKLGDKSEVLYHTTLGIVDNSKTRTAMQLPEMTTERELIVGFAIPEAYKNSTGKLAFIDMDTMKAYQITVVDGEVATIRISLGDASSVANFALVYADKTVIDNDDNSGAGGAGGTTGTDTTITVKPTDKKSTTPKTGDTVLPIAVFGFAALISGAAGFTVYKKKRSK